MNIFAYMNAGTLNMLFTLVSKRLYKYAALWPAKNNLNNKLSRIFNIDPSTLKVVLITLNLACAKDCYLFNSNLYINIPKRQGK